MNSLHISLCREGELLPVGSIAETPDGVPFFSYLESYAESQGAIPLSHSLPLTSNPYGESQFKPYFEGLLAEGGAREALAAELGIRESDYRAMLAACGRDCIGDVVIESANDPQLNRSDEYESIDAKRISHFFQSLPSASKENINARLSLAGAQSKIGLAHIPSEPMGRGWLKPHGLAASTHILKTSHIEKLVDLEFLCMKAAKECGIRVPNVALLDYRKPVLAVERFDRRMRMDGGQIYVERIHQEDFAQAFGLVSASKYAELKGGSIATIAQWLRNHTTRPAENLSQFAKTVCFNFVIGNCDAHLKNFSITYTREGNTTFCQLAPAYDLVSTELFDRFSKDMAMALGNARNINDVRPGDFALLARDLGITKQFLKTLATPIANNIDGAIRDAGNGLLGETLESTPYLADDLRDNIATRLNALKEFVKS